ncbi:DUF4012 domain-containing protein [Micromonospora echinofusca]|uniref:DUF4012 domain-containing protein n=2 Tax=Micromonospora echinofusca TaxID=47858 RepID=A0ABS3VX30_MICEH|nr:DUF4012 domain-containing protein [Micromonospora echinofusca]
MLLLGAGWVGYRGWRAYGHLNSAAAMARQLGGEVLGGDRARALRTLAALQEQTASARSATADPGWWLGTHVPYTGDDLAAVRDLAVTIDELARHAFPALLRIDPAVLVPRSGRFDVAGLRAAATSLDEADQAVRRARTRISGVPDGELHAQVRSAVATLRDELAELGTVTGGASTAARLLPALLGGDGGRHYLMVSQNPAELRATGGMFGAYALVQVTGGRLKLVRQGPSTELGRFAPPVLPLDAELRGLYRNLPGSYPADVNLTPHFPTAAALYREMYRRHTGRNVDGVLATDPVMLSYLLQATGPVAVPEHTTLAAATVTRTLLSDTYQRLNPREQDEYFAASAMAVFNSLLGRTVEPRAVLAALDRAVTERRLLFWSARPAEQRELAGTRVGGVLPAHEDTPTVGVFLNDGSGAKLGWYLHPAATLTVGGCRPDGRRELRLRVTLRSTAPRSGLAGSVTGLALSGDPYTARTLVNVHSPAGGTVVNARLDGRPVRVGSGTERRRQVAIANVEVRPGATRTLEVTLLTPAGAGGTADLWLTPAAHPWTTRIQSASTTCEQ